MDNVEKGPAPQEVGDEGVAIQSSSPSGGAGPEVSDAAYVPTHELSEAQVASACAGAMRFAHRTTDICTMALIGEMWCTYQPWADAEQAFALADRFPKIAMEVFAIVYRARNTSDGKFGNLREPIYKEPMKLLAHTVASRWRSERGRKTLS